MPEAELPTHLATLVKRAVRDELPDLSDKGLNTPLGTNFYTLAWGLSFFISGDKDHALMRLEKVYELCSTPAGVPEQKSFKTYPIPEETKPKACSSCGAEIFWIVTENKKRLPVTANGRSHFETCANAASHSKGRKKTT